MRCAGTGALLCFPRRFQPPAPGGLEHVQDVLQVVAAEQIAPAAVIERFKLGRDKCACRNQSDLPAAWQGQECRRFNCMGIPAIGEPENLRVCGHEVDF